MRTTPYPLFPPHRALAMAALWLALSAFAASAAAQSTPQARSEQSPPPNFENVQGQATTQQADITFEIPAQAAAKAGAEADANTEAASPLSPSAADAALPADSMLRAQVLLERARFSPGELDGEGGTNTRRAIAAFQRAHDLSDTGELDAATWEALRRDDAPALVDYTITPADAAGPFVAVPEDMMAEAELPALGYETLAEALGEKFHSSPDLLARLNPGKSFAAGVTIAVPNVSGLPALAKPDKIVVDKSDSSVSLVDAEGKVYARYPASSGSQHDPLPIGTWKINGVSREPEFRYNPELFWDADESHAKAVIKPGPNNPVGVKWIDLSKEHYGIHGTPEPSRIGKSQSHGCIRMTNWSVREIAELAKPGMIAVLQP
ncbi:MAG TPA: L,D-transpeptidase [Xanthomonadaceae bacterium]|nr:L,D-transpeptidase [Xanthomonadaceae bacterium]